MSNKDGGGPAFPLTADVIRNVSAMLAASDLTAERRDYLLEKFGERATGMTVRDAAALAVLPAIYTEFFTDQRQGGSGCPSDWRAGLADDAYKMADAMLKARDA